MITDSPAGLTGTHRLVQKLAHGVQHNRRVPFLKSPAKGMPVATISVYTIFGQHHSTVDQHEYPGITIAKICDGTAAVSKP